MDRKRQLKEEYKSTKLPMGILALRCIKNGNCYLKGSVNLKATENSLRFQLGMGNYPQKTLLSDWKEYGEAGFSFEVLDTLEYDKDETKTDYREDIEVLRQIWKDKLEESGVNVILI